MNIEMISTGDEVLCGYITDTNATFLSAELLNIGLKIHRRTTVGDSLDELVNIFNERAPNADVVIVNGGMGPTSDDLSRYAAAKAAHVDIKLNPKLVAKMEAWFKERNKEMPSNNIIQAEIPVGAEIIPNAIGTACGFKLTIQNCIFIFTPGVPSEFKKMVTDWIIPFLKTTYPVASHSKVELFYSFGIGESKLGEILEQETWPDNIVLGYRVDNPYIEIKLISENAEHTDFKTAENILQKAAKPYLIANHKFDFYEQIAQGLNKRPLLIEDWNSNGTIFSLTKVIPHVSGAINSALTQVSDDAVILRIKPLKPNHQGQERDLTITLEDKKNHFTYHQNFRFGVSLNRLGLYGSFMALDLLRRYLTKNNPTVDYEYVKTITELS